MNKSFCYTCKKEKDLSQFYIRKSGKIYSYCKECQAEKMKLWRIENPEKQKEYGKNRSYITLRKGYLKTAYNISLEDYDKMLQQQEGRCAICRGINTYHHNVFHIDHNHVTGKIRGLLCTHCNRAIGLFKESISSLENAIIYLRDKT